MADGKGTVHEIHLDDGKRTVPVILMVHVIHSADEKRTVNETHWGHKKQSADVI